MSHYKLMSFDIWDTILRRKCHPDEIKLFIARYIYLKHFTQLSPDFKDYYQIYYERCRIEGEIGKKNQLNGHDDEYCHIDVLESLVMNITEGTVSNPRDVASELLLVELEQEKVVCYLDSEIERKLSIVSSDRKTFISDFYSDKSYIEQLLSHVNFGTEYIDGYVSSKFLLNKRSGKLFQHIHSSIFIRPEEHIHIGDNPIADVESPKRLGIQTIHFYHEQEEEKRKQKQHIYEKRMNDKQFTVEISNSELEGLNREQLELFKIGRKYGVIFYTFVMEIIEKAMKDGHQKVYYLTREGEFFKRIHDDIVRNNPYGMELPSSELLEVSRVATFASSLREVSLTEMMRLWNQYSTQSMTSFFKSLDIQAEDFLPFLEKYDIDPNKDIQYPWLHEHVQRLFADESFCRFMKKNIDQKKRSLLRYMMEKGIVNDGTPIFLVDIGWRGTIQDNLSYILPNKMVDGYYVGLFDFINEQPSNVLKNGFLTRNEMNRILRFVSPFEMICNSSSGSVIRYDSESSQAIKAMDTKEDNIHHKYISYFQNGVMSCGEEITSTINIHALTSSDLKFQALKALEGLMQNPPIMIAKAFFELTHNETFGVGGYVHKKGNFPYVYAALSIISKRSRRLFKQMVEDSAWPQGLFVYNRIPFISRIYNKHINKILQSSIPATKDKSNNEVTRYQEEIAVQRMMLEERYTSMMEMEQMIIERDNTIQEWGKLLEERYAAIQKMELMIEERDRRIEELQKLVHSYKIV